MQARPIGPIAALVAVFAVGWGCDPTATGPADGSEAKPSRKDAVAEPDPATPAGVAACIDRCRAGPGDRRTDAETCRLLCQDPAADAPTTLDTVLARYETCEDACGPSSSTNRATCALQCAGSTPAAIAEATAEVRTCMRPCLESLAQCGGGCTADRGTNRETCRLQCDANARKCLSDCLPSAG